MQGTVIDKKNSVCDFKLFEFIVSNFQYFVSDHMILSWHYIFEWADLVFFRIFDGLGARSKLHVKNPECLTFFGVISPDRFCLSEANSLPRRSRFCPTISCPSSRSL